jgi:hypothetical protein
LEQCLGGYSKWYVRFTSAEEYSSKVGQLLTLDFVENSQRQYK